MFGIFKRKNKPEKEKNNNSNDELIAEKDISNNTESVSEENKSNIDEGSKITFFQKLKNGLNKTRDKLGSSIADIFLGKKEINTELLEQLETRLLSADLGPAVVEKLIKIITDKLARNELNDTEVLFNTLKDELENILNPYSSTLEISAENKPYVILMVGVNGAGKTTTAGKIASQLKNEGKSVMLAAGDTFRAAAVEQLQEWGKRIDVPVVAQQIGSDSASVLFDAFQSARAKGCDVLLADTAGRLHNKDTLMEELKKIKRVLGKIDANAPHEIMLVLDSTTGQNAIAQAETFNKHLDLSSLVLTKLDGTAKGGAIFAIADKLKLPIKYIGVGEKTSDLDRFNAKEFVDALFTSN